VTSSAVNRWTAIRIDFQAYLIATVFAFYALFLTGEVDIHQMAVVAIGFQMSVEIARFFNYAVRWQVNVENNMVYAQRVMRYAQLKSEKRPI